MTGLLCRNGCDAVLHSPFEVAVQCPPPRPLLAAAKRVILDRITEITDSLEGWAHKMKIKQLYSHPIKSLRPIPLSTVLLTPTGISNDRRFMFFKYDPSNADPTKRLEFMTVTYFPHMGLFTQELSETDKGKFTVTYRPPPGKGEERSLDLKLEPSTEELEELEVDLHGSGTKALNMGKEINDWFSECFGWAVVLVYMPEGSRRQVLGNLSPNAVSKTGITSSAKSWLSTITAYTPEYLKGKEGKDEGLTFADCAPYLVVTDESVKDVSSRLPDGTEMDVTKFRPNIVLEGADEAYEEDYWGALSIVPGSNTNLDGKIIESEGRDLEIVLTQNCIRCQSLDIDYTTGTFGKGENGTVLKKLMRDRRVDKGKKYSPVFGRYGFLGEKSDGGGVRVSVGDEVRVTKRNEERTEFCKFAQRMIGLVSLLILG
ncbi:MAG: hypothetical protein Q9170_004880 [Blastenia crenularia]